jgi:hypothetical protein
VGSIGVGTSLYSLYNYQEVIQKAKAFDASVQINAVDLAFGVQTTAINLQTACLKAGPLNGLYLNESISNSFLNSRAFVYTPPTANPLAVARYINQYYHQLAFDEMQKSQALHKSLFSLMDSGISPATLVANDLLDEVIFELCVEVATALI